MGPYRKMRTFLLKIAFVYRKKYNHCMNDFISQYGLSILLCAIGLFFIIMSYGAAFAGRSGVPFVGGLFIVVGFLISPMKWLALLGLIDYGYWTIPYFMVLDHIRRNRFEAIYAEKGYIPKITDDTKSLCIKIPDRNEELIRPYITNYMYELRIPKLLFSVCTDNTGKRFMLVDKCIKGGQIEILEFDKDSILLTGQKSKDVNMTVEIEIIDKDKN